MDACYVGWKSHFRRLFLLDPVRLHKCVMFYVVLCWFEVTDPLLCCSSLVWDQSNTMALGFGYFFCDGITKVVLKWNIRKKLKQRCKVFLP